MRRRNLAMGKTFGLMLSVLLGAGLLPGNPGPALAAGPMGIVCIECHTKLPGKYGEPVNLWQGSIHAENNIACHACHGGDPKDAPNAMNPDRGFLGVPKETEIPAFCGRCHVGVLKDYLGSLHGKALGNGGPTCVTCHSNHRVVKASLELINAKDCSRCHSYERAARIRAVMGATEERIVAIAAGIAAGKEEGIETDHLEKSLFALRNSFHSLFHTVDVERVSRETTRIQGELQKLDDLLLGIAAGRSQRQLIGAAAVAGALLVALFCYLLRKSYEPPDR